MTPRKRRARASRAGGDRTEAHHFLVMPTAVVRASGISDRAKLLYFALAAYDFKRKGYVYPGIKTLARDLGWTKADVRQSLQELQERGWLWTEVPDSGLPIHHLRAHEWSDTVPGATRRAFDPT